METLKKIIETVVLPSEVTDFENRYVSRINHVGWWFYVAHLPVFMAVAMLNGTGVWDAVWLTGLVLAGPGLAFRQFENPRHVAVVFGITAMLMGGLLVHFGQGPVQIEMHFYFFALLAMLSVYGNPMVIVAAAVTVALHHLLVWWFLPASVFNYEAPFWVVGVHAAFVVLESVATVSIARGFFDNVIGLERIVQERTVALNEKNQEMRLVLDNVDQALITLTTKGIVVGDSSRVTQEWFGPIEAGADFIERLAKINERQAKLFRFGLEDIERGLMPMEVLLEQLPAQLEVNGQHLAVHYNPILVDGSLERILAVVTDVTSKVERERLEADNQEIFNIFTAILTDKKGFFEFYEEAEDMIELLRSEQYNTGDAAKRIIHTLKGNAGVFAMNTFARECHDVETKIAQTGESPTASTLAPILNRWDSIKKKLDLLIEDADGRIEIDNDEFLWTLQAVLNGDNREEIAERIANWKLERTDVRLARIAKQAEGIARRLQKGNVKIEYEGGDLRLEPGRWTRFWSTFVHAVRNAVDHGIEESSERLAAGKPEDGCITINTLMENGEFVVEVKDDGRGVDWETVRQKAIEYGLPADSTGDLRVALFKDGLSTREAASEFSGRGIGMAALREASEALGGSVAVTSEVGEGTSMRFTFPAEAMAARPADVLSNP